MEDHRVHWRAQQRADLTPDQSSRLKRLVAFHADLVRYCRLLREHQADVEEAWMGDVPAPGRSPKLERLRQSLLRQVGWVQRLFERLVGRIVQPAPAGGASPEDIWWLALRDQFRPDQADSAGVIADHLVILIGQLEDNPALFDAPSVRPAADSDNAPFTQAERDTIALALDQVEGMLRTMQQVADDRHQSVMQEFQDLRQASTRLGRKDWANSAVNVVGSALISAGLAPDRARDTLWRAMSPLSHMFSQAQLPG